VKRKKQFPVVVREGSVSAKIYRTPTSNGYDAFTLVYWRADQRTREAFADLAAAQRRGRDVVCALAAGEIEGAGMTGQDLAAFLRANDFLKPTGITLESACKEFAEACKLLNGVSVVQAARDYAKGHSILMETRSVQQVVEEFLDAKTQGRATKTRSSGKRVSEKYLEDLRRKLNAFSARFHCQIGQVTGQDINEFINDLPYGGRTKNNYLQAVNVLFEFAKKQKYMSKDSTVLDDVEGAEESEFEIEIFSPDELTKLLQHAPPCLVPVLAIGAFAGLRSAEIERLDWTEINLAHRHIEVKAKKSKTRSRRLAPISDNLASWLVPIMQSEGKVWSHCPQYLYELQAETANDAGVQWKHNALRHSFISYRVAVVKSIDQVAIEAGNSPQMIFQHYRELVSPAQAARWFSIVSDAIPNVIAITPAAAAMA
jgi:integrase